jgi:reactive chlorine resistance protein C
MLRITPPATAAATAEHPLATAGRHLARYGLVAVIAWIGALKYTPYEAAVIQPLIAHSPVFSGVYGVVSVRAFAAALGTAEIIAALLIAVRPLSPRVSAVGSSMGVLLFASTLSFLFTTPGVTAASGFPGAVGAARPVPPQGPGAGRRCAVDPGRLAGRRLRAAWRAWPRAARVIAADRRAGRVSPVVSAIKHFRSASLITAAPGWACAHVSRRWGSERAARPWGG